MKRLTRKELKVLEGERKARETELKLLKREALKAAHQLVERETKIALLIALDHLAKERK